MAERKGQSRQRAEKGQSGAHDVPAVQWLVAGVALLVVLASFAIVAYQGLIGGDTPPVVTVAVDSISRDSAGYRAHFTVRNGGGQTAANVIVNAELVGSAVASASMQFDYLAPGATATGAFQFSSDPRAGQLRTSIGGFTIP